MANSVVKGLLGGFTGYLQGVETRYAEDRKDKAAMTIEEFRAEKAKEVEQMRIDARAAEAEKDLEFREGQEVLKYKDSDEKAQTSQERWEAEQKQTVEQADLDRKSAESIAAQKKASANATESKINRVRDQLADKITAATGIAASQPVFGGSGAANLQKKMDNYKAAGGTEEEKAQIQATAELWAKIDSLFVSVETMEDLERAQEEADALLEQYVAAQGGGGVGMAVPTAPPAAGPTAPDYSGYSATPIDDAKIK